jgi:hypothetical protein
VGRTLGQGLLYTDWKCFESSSATSLVLFKCLPSTSSWMELEFLFLKEIIIIIIILIIIIIIFLNYKMVVNTCLHVHKFYEISSKNAS